MAASYDWDNAYENAPSGTDGVGGGDDEFRKLKQSIRERLEHEHFFKDATDNKARDGYHKTESGGSFAVRQSSDFTKLLLEVMDDASRTFVRTPFSVLPDGTNSQFEVTATSAMFSSLSAFDVTATTSTFTGALHVTDSVTFDKDLSCDYLTTGSTTAASTIAGPLNVNGDSTFSGTTNTFDNDVVINGNLNNQKPHSGFYSVTGLINVGNSPTNGIPAVFRMVINPGQWGNPTTFKLYSVASLGISYTTGSHSYTLAVKILDDITDWTDDNTVYGVGSVTENHSLSVPVNASGARLVSAFTTNLQDGHEIEVSVTSKDTSVNDNVVSLTLTFYYEL